MTTTATAVREVEKTATWSLDLPATGAVPVTVSDRDRTRTFLLLHGGAGPASVSAFGDLLAGRSQARVIVPTHPGFNGTPRPEGLASVAGLARLYADLLDRLDVRDVTVIGNSIGGWIAAELALTGSPRVSAAVLIDAAGAQVEGHAVADVSALTPQELAAKSFYDPSRLAPPPGAPAPSPELVRANLGTLAVYGGPEMSDPTLLSRLGGLNLPVHVIWGEADQIVDPDYGRALAAAIPGARFTLLARAGHLPQLEAPEELLGAITVAAQA